VSQTQTPFSQTTTAALSVGRPCTYIYVRNKHQCCHLSIFTLLFLFWNETKNVGNYFLSNPRTLLLPGVLVKCGWLVFKQEFIQTLLFFFFAVWTMHSHMINKGPTHASKYQCISTLVHCYMFRRFKASSSGSSVWVSWIVAQSRENRTGWGLYIVTVCVVVGMVPIRILQLDTFQTSHRWPQYMALILFCFHEFGQQFSRLKLNFNLMNK
jgi:hypothetical protein